MEKKARTKAYRLFDPEENKIYVSRDVKFEENKTWTWKRKNDSTQMGTFMYVSTHQTQGEEYILVSPRSAQSDYENEEQGSASGTPTSTSHLNPDNYDDSCEPKRVRLINDIYRDTEEVELDEDSMLIGVKEQVSYKQAVKDQNWKQAMAREMESIEKNGTWSLQELPTGHKVIG